MLHMLVYFVYYAAIPHEKYRSWSNLSLTSRCGAFSLCQNFHLLWNTETGVRYVHLFWLLFILLTMLFNLITSKLDFGTVPKLPWTLLNFIFHYPFYSFVNQSWPTIPRIPKRTFGTRSYGNWTEESLNEATTLLYPRRISEIKNDEEICISALKFYSKDKVAKKVNQPTTSHFRSHRINTVYKLNY